MSRIEYKAYGELRSWLKVCTPGIGTRDATEEDLALAGFVRSTPTRDGQAPEQAPQGAPRRVLAGGELASVVRDDLDPPFSVLVERDDLTRERYQPDYVVPADTTKPEEPR
jgi:hypothetical protein